MEQLLNRWIRWSATADRSEDGWQSDFPEWGQLIGSAKSQMLVPDLGADSVRIMSSCWEVSEESEELLDYAKENIDRCWPVVEAVGTHGGPRARWQAYEAATAAGVRAEAFLRSALADGDSYAKRRGALALARLRPNDSKEIAEALMCEKDPYLRQAAIEFVLACGDRDFTEKASERLERDDSEHVREAARTRL